MKNKTETRTLNSIAEMLSDLPKKIVDESACTIKELAEASSMSETWMTRTAKSKVEAGEWEKVWKKSGDRLIPAYRKKK